MNNMGLEERLPMVVFDNQCYLCVKFAKVVNFFARGKIAIIGHYSNEGMKIRNEVLDESALDMFWYIDKKAAYGGRAALFPLIKSIIFKKTRFHSMTNIDEQCQQDCKTVKAVFLRSSSLLKNSKKINLC